MTDHYDLQGIIARIEREQLTDPDAPNRCSGDIRGPLASEVVDLLRDLQGVVTTPGLTAPQLGSNVAHLFNLDYIRDTGGF